jgi:hypothetical protein
MERDGFLRIVILLYGFVPKSFASVAPKTRACFPDQALARKSWLASLGSQVLARLKWQESSR